MVVDSFDSAIPVVLWVAGATVVSALCAVPMRRAAESPVVAIDRERLPTA